MAESAPQYRLVVFDELDDLVPVRDLFASVTKTHPTDAMQWVARVPGVWPKPLDEPTSRKLLDGLFELEIAAEAWRLDAFPDLGVPRTIHEASCEKDGFRVIGLRGEPTHWVTWDKFELISAGWINTEDEYRDVSPPSWISAINSGARLLTGRNPARGRQSRAMRIPRDPMPEVLLIRKEPRVTFRVIAGKMNYAYLGDRLKPSSSENFPQFLAEVCLRAESAYLTYPTRNFLKGASTEDDLFENSQALMDYSLHRLLWSWYRRAAEEDSGHGDTQS